MPEIYADSKCCLKYKVVRKKYFILECKKCRKIYQYH